jgi:hypothetical protein
MRQAVFIVHSGANELRLEPKSKQMQFAKVVQHALSKTNCLCCKHCLKSFSGTAKFLISILRVKNKLRNYAHKTNLHINCAKHKHIKSHRTAPNDLFVSSCHEALSEGLTPACRLLHLTKRILDLRFASFALCFVFLRFVDIQYSRAC